MVIEFYKYSFQIQMPRKIPVNIWYLYEYKIIIKMTLFSIDNIYF